MEIEIKPLKPIKCFKTKTKQTNNCKNSKSLDFFSCLTEWEITTVIKDPVAMPVAPLDVDRVGRGSL